MPAEVAETVVAARDVDAERLELTAIDAAEGHPGAGVSVAVVKDVTAGGVQIGVGGAVMIVQAGGALADVKDATAGGVRIGVGGAVRDIVTDGGANAARHDEFAATAVGRGSTSIYRRSSAITASMTIVTSSGAAGSARAGAFGAAGTTAASIIEVLVLSLTVAIPSAKLTGHLRGRGPKGRVVLLPDVGSLIS